MSSAVRRLLLGAKAISYWRDCYKGCDEKFMKSVGPVDQKPWWPDFPNLRREVDRLLPLIRQPHWTNWSVKVDPPDGVRVGTRELDGEAYLIAVNQTAAPRAVILRVEGLPYTAKEARSYFDAAKSWPVRDGSIALQLGGIGVDSGTLALRLPRAD